MKRTTVTIAGAVGLLAVAMTVSGMTETQAVCDTAMGRAQTRFLACLAQCDQRAERLATRGGFDVRRCHARCGARFGRLASRILSVCSPAQTVNMGVNDFNTICNASDPGGLFDCLGDLEDAGCVTVDGIGGAFDCGSAIPPGHGGAGVAGGPGPGNFNDQCPHGVVYDASRQCDCLSPPYWELTTPSGRWCGICEAGCPHVSPAGQVSCCPTCRFGADGACLSESNATTCFFCAPPPSTE